MKISVGKLQRISPLLILACFIVTSVLFPFQAQAKRQSMSNLVEINDDYFSPETIKIHAGEKITWVNDGEKEHTVTSEDGRFNSGRIPPDGHVTVTFNNPGEYRYACSIHTLLGIGMKGIVIVEP